jgi:nucleoside-diphosphate-sugar epimerase
MRVLLVGAAGFVGRPTLDLLRTRHEVTAFDLRPVDGCRDAVCGDLLDWDVTHAAVAGHDAVVHAAMAPNPSYGPGGPGFTINTTGFFHIIEAARLHGVQRFVHTSSGGVHNGYPVPGTFLANDLYPLKATGTYAASKLLQEALARNAAECYGLSVAVIRPGDIVDVETGLTTDGTPATYTWRSIDRHDVAAALVAALEVEGVAYECFYAMASRRAYELTDAARTEARLAWKPARLFDGEPRG